VNQPVACHRLAQPDNLIEEPPCSIQAISSIKRRVEGSSEFFSLAAEPASLLP